MHAAPQPAAKIESSPAREHGGKLEEYQMLAGSSQNLAAPGAVTLTARTAGSNESGVPSGGTMHVSVTALNYFGETAKSTDASVAWTAGQVVDVTIAPVA